jgi:hypothetical protein
VSTTFTNVRAKLNIHQAHRLLGHKDEESMRTTGRELGWILTQGTLKPCLHCAKAKAKYQNVYKESTTPKATVPGGRVYLDPSKVTVSKMDGSEFKLMKNWWTTIIDEMTRKNGASSLQQRRVWWIVHVSSCKNETEGYSNSNHTDTDKTIWRKQSA